jgi:hypothetical protein
MLHRKIRLAAGTAAAAALMGGGLLAAAPAFASNCPVGGCVTTGSVQVTATITETIDNTAFTLGSGPVAAGQTVGPDYGAGWYTGSGPSPAGYTADTLADYTVGVATGDGAGYTINGTATQFGKAGAPSFPFSALMVHSWNAHNNAGAGTATQPTLNGTPQQVALSNAPTAGGGDSYAFADSLNVPLSAGNGTYTAQLTYSAIAN